MKYVCQKCDKLVEEPYAVDGDGYYCSSVCFNEDYSDDKEVEEILTSETVKKIPEMKYDWRGNPKPYK